MKLEVQPAARNDILRQIEYYRDERDAATVAARFLDAVELAFHQLREMPHVGSPRRFANPLLKGLRSWPVPGFSVLRMYYIHSGETLRVVRILHGQLDLQAVLGEEAATQEK